MKWLFTFGSEVEKSTEKLSGSQGKYCSSSPVMNTPFLLFPEKRIGVQAIENLVKKYSREITTTKKITPS